MSQIVKSNSNTVSAFEGFTQDRVDLIKRMVAVGATDDELQLFLNQARKMGLDPLSKQIYFQKYKNQKTGESKVTIIVGIDGYRVVAERTGKYAGSDDPIFDDEKNPTKATVTVYKLIGGIRCPFTASARWDEYCPQPPKDYMWKRMPNTMLGKCAEGLALRKAFPAELSGSYTKEEMDQAEGPQIKAAIVEATVQIEETKLKKLLEAFELLGIDQLKLEEFLEKPLSEATEQDLEMLRGLYIQNKPGLSK